jgi:hypothetical protein
VGAPCDTGINHCTGNTLYYCSIGGYIIKLDCASYSADIGQSTQCTQTTSTAAPCDDAPHADCCPGTASTTNYCANKTDDTYCDTASAGTPRVVVCKDHKEDPKTGSCVDFTSSSYDPTCSSFYSCTLDSKTICCGDD